MICEKQAKWFCCEDISLIKNYEEAVNSSEKWHCHHKLGLYFDVQWLKDNGFYYKQRAEMLVFMKHDEHLRLHGNGKSSRLGKFNSKEHTRKIIEANRNHPKKSKKVNQYTKYGEFVATYPSMKEAGRQTGVDFHLISHCCNGNRKSAGGFVWRRAD